METSWPEMKVVWKYNKIWAGLKHAVEIETWQARCNHLTSGEDDYCPEKNQTMSLSQKSGPMKEGWGKKKKKIQPSFKWLITFLLGSRRHFKRICALTTQLCTPHSHCSSHLGVFSEWLEISYFRFFRMIFLSQAGIRSHSCDGDKQTWQLLTQQSTKIVCRLFPE